MGNTQINDILMEVLNGAQSGDPQAMLIAGLSGALILILLLMVVIAVMGRKSGKAAENTPNMPAEEPQIEVQERPDTPPATAQATSGPAVLDSPDTLEQTDDFMIFKRSERAAPQRKEEAMPSAEGLSIEENLQLIEREMIKLRDMFKQGHVTRDVYVDETRNLYHQARAVAALR